MATIENNGLFTYVDAKGNKYLLYPITKAENVDGLEEKIADYKVNIMDYAKQIGAPRDLLVNSDWRDSEKIINQRGATSYTGAKMTIDRWRSHSPTLKVEISSNGYLVLTNTNTGEDRASFSQKIGTGFVGKTLTVAVCGRSNKVYCFSKVVPEVTNEVQNFCLVDFDGHTARLNLNTSGELSFLIMVDKAQSANIRWVALYEGQYTTDTISEYKSREFGSDLIECKKHCQRLTIYGAFRCVKLDGNSMKFVIPAPVRMRVIPTIESGTMSVKNLSGVAQEGFTFVVGSRGENYITIDATKTGHGLTDGYLYMDSNVILSADLV